MKKSESTNYPLLAKALDNYIKLLSDEIDDLVGVAAFHGWKSTNIEEGKRLRSIIAKLRKINQ
jgi:hypothetical protein